MPRGIRIKRGPMIACPACGDQFEQKSGSHKFCCRGCAYDFKRMNQIAAKINQGRPPDAMETAEAARSARLRRTTFCFLKLLHEEKLRAVCEGIAT